MTRDEAIKILEPIMFLDAEKDEALHVAIEALERKRGELLGKPLNRNEAIAKLKIYKDYLCKMSSPFDVNEVAKPFNMAIEALERKKGEWEQKNRTSDYCNICGFEETHWLTQDYNYCPNCGAEMRQRGLGFRIM